MTPLTLEEKIALAQEWAKAAQEAKLSPEQTGALAAVAQAWAQIAMVQMLGRILAALEKR